MLSETTPQSKPVIACDPSPITPAQRERWLVIAVQMYSAIQEIQDLPDGYAFRLPCGTEVLALIAEDLNMERLCCPFVRYTLELELQQGPFWLRMTGGPGVKEFLRMALEGANLIDERVARAAGFDVSSQKELTSVETTLEAIDELNERFASSVGTRSKQD